MKIRKVEATAQKSKLRVAAYCRVSTKRTEQEDSLEIQQATYTSYVLSNPEWSFAGLYSDTRSGLNAEKREGFMRMISDACAGKIDLILCKSISRFSRNIVECQRYTELLRSKNITIVFEKEHIRTDQPTSNLIFSLMCAIAQDESRSISENVRLSYQSRFKRGEYNLGNNRILGYDCADGKLVPNEDAWIVRLIYNLFLEGKPYREIGRRIQEAGAVGKRSHNLLAPSTIYGILRNETYVGDKLLQKQPPCDFITKRPQKGVTFESNYLKDDHEPIIDRKEWNAVQEILNRREEMKKKGVDTRARNSGFLFGKVICGECGTLYTRRTYKGHAKENAADPETYKVWVCKERFRGKNGNGCRNQSIREDRIIQEVVTQLGWVEFDEKLFEEIVNSVVIEKSGITVRLKEA